ncbi:MAG: DUF1735 domain-containing protein [Bacteroidia bacterium]|nr:DUF1735 domain-containing protein [Bacteroidia bacterium]
MKKLFIFLLLMTIVSSCYDDYIKDYNYSAVYFTYQIDVRTFVVGEGMKVVYGVALAGIMENKQDRTVEYKIDTTLLTPVILARMKASSQTYIKDATTPVTQLKLLPAGYYSTTNGSTFIISKGQNSGKVTITPDSALFLSDPKTLIPNYALPLLITQADADSIPVAKKYSVIALKYENMLFGNYWHGGVTIVKDASNNPIDTILYYTTIPSPEDRVWTLYTAAPFDLNIKKYSSTTSTKPELKLTMDGGNITIGSATGSTYTFLPDGPSIFNQAKLLQDRKIYLNYKYQISAGNWCYATDTLTFRNRLRDGVNEWMDENP